MNWRTNKPPAYMEIIFQVKTMDMIDTCIGFMHEKGSLHNPIDCVMLEYDINDIIRWVSLHDILKEIKDD